MRCVRRAPTGIFINAPVHADCTSTRRVSRLHTRESCYHRASGCMTSSRVHIQQRMCVTLRWLLLDLANADCGEKNSTAICVTTRVDFAFFEENINWNFPASHERRLFFSRFSLGACCCNDTQTNSGLGWRESERYTRSGKRCRARHMPPPTRREGVLAAPRKGLKCTEEREDACFAPLLMH